MSADADDSHRPPDSRRQTDRADLIGTTALFKVVIAQASFIAALMFYLGAIYTTSFYGYFHLTLSSLNFGFSQLVLQSLRLLRLDVLVVAVAILTAAVAPWSGTAGSLADRATRRVRTTAARVHLMVVGTGLVLLMMWPVIQPYGWVAFLTIAAGLLLGQCPDAKGDRPQGFRRSATTFFAAGLFLFCALTQVAWQFGEQDARDHARDITRWTGVLILSTDQLSLPSDHLFEEDLGPSFHHRYRYTGLRLLIERDGRYYVAPRVWDPERDALYVIRESDSIWVALTPGTQPRRASGAHP